MTMKNTIADNFDSADKDMEIPVRLLKSIAEVEAGPVLHQTVLFAIPDQQKVCNHHHKKISKKVNHHHSCSRDAMSAYNGFLV